MAYETRWLQNFKFGTLASAASISDTVLSSSGFASLASNLTTAVYMPIALINPATGAFEIVWATAHTAAATTVTVVRGREGTSAAAWPAGTTWLVGPTLYDALYPTTRAALPSDLHVGARAVIGDEQIAVQKTMHQGVAASVISNPADMVGGTGALAANHHALLKFVRFDSTTNGSGNLTINLPNSGFAHRNLGVAITLENLSQASWGKVVSLSTTQVVVQFWDTIAGVTAVAASKPVQGYVLAIGA